MTVTTDEDLKAEIEMRSRLRSPHSLAVMRGDVAKIEPVPHPAKHEAEMIANALRRIAANWCDLSHLSGPEALHQCANDLDPPKSWFHPESASLLAIINEGRVKRGFRPFPVTTAATPLPGGAGDTPASLTDEQKMRDFFGGSFAGFPPGD